MYRHEWESDPKLAGWLSPDPTDVDKAWCNYCQASLSCSTKSNLTRHAETQKHARNSLGQRSLLRNPENLGTSIGKGSPLVRDPIAFLQQKEPKSRSEASCKVSPLPDLYDILERMQNLLIDVQSRVTVLEKGVQSCQRQLMELSERESDIDQKMDELVMPMKKILEKIIKE